MSEGRLIVSTNDWCRALGIAPPRHEGGEVWPGRRAGVARIVRATSNSARVRPISAPTMPGPHDALFKVVFGDPAHAEGELRSVLPASVVAALDFTTLRRVPGSFIDGALSERQTDVLFVVETQDGQPVLIYVLLEHQSTDDALMPLRVLGYLARIWDAHVAENGRTLPLPPILPIVVAHAAGGWRSATRFEEILALDGASAAFAPFEPRFRFALDDLSSVSDDALLARTMTAAAKVVWLALKHAQDDLLGALDGVLDLLREIKASSEPERVLMALWRYTLLVTDDRERTIELAGKVDDEVRAMAMTAGERLMMEGEKRGVVLGQRMILVAQLTRRFGPLAATVEARIQSASADDLTRWAERVLDATSIEAVFAG